MASLYEEHAREILGLDDSYQMAKWVSLMRGIRVEMVQCPLKDDGVPDWPRADENTRKPCVFTDANHNAWVLGWERHTGKCSLCHPGHPGQEWMGWSNNTGSVFRTCPRCGGTNKAPVAA